MGKINPPEPLTEKHDLSEFDCGYNVLNEWLQKRAMKNEASGASRTFVITTKKKVIGYYALASGSVERMEAPGSISRNMPNPIPVIILARLAIDKKYQSQRLGSSLLKDAIQRAVFVSKDIGVRALLVHTLNDEAKSFYQRYGFIESPIDNSVLYVSCKHLYEYFKGD